MVPIFLPPDLQPILIPDFRLAHSQLRLLLCTPECDGRGEPINVVGFVDHSLSVDAQHSRRGDSTKTENADPGRSLIDVCNLGLAVSSGNAVLCISLEEAVQPSAYQNM